MDEVLHLDVQFVRLLGVLHVECIKTTIFRDNAHVCLALEPSLGSLDSNHILCTVSLASHDVGRTQVHVGYGGREDNMHGLVEGHLQSVRRNHAVVCNTSRQPLKQVAILGQFRILCIHCACAHKQGASNHQNCLHSHNRYFFCC